MKLDADVKAMTLVQLRREVMRLRRCFRSELNNTGNRRCWITLLTALPEGEKIQPLSLPEKVFVNNCRRYYRRNQA